MHTSLCQRATPLKKDKDTMTTISVKDIQSGDTNEISENTPCLVINGTYTSDTAVNGATAEEAAKDAEGHNAYGVRISTVGEWSRTAPGKQAYVFETGADGAPWWLSEIEG